MSETDLTKIPKDQIKGFECVFATYCQNHMLGSDALVVKENVHLKDGRTIPRVRIIRDKKWPFWVTRKGFRNHESQKEYETFDKLQRFDSTRINLPKAVTNALGIYSASGTMKELSRSPYLYGTDISPVSLIKDLYRRKFPDCRTQSHRVAALDIETDVKWGTEEIIMNNITMKGKSYTAITKKFVDNYPNFIEECHKRADKLLEGELKRDGIDWQIEIVDSPADCVIKVIEKAHEWKPDFISIWNMKFDIPKMQEALERENIDPADVFSDPSVPPQFRWFQFKIGKPTRTKQDGSKMSLHHADLWHVCTTPASFYFIDSMCLYKRIRTARGNAASYSLNYTLIANDLDPKMKIDALKEYENDGDMWHFLMQRDYRVEYTIYNLIDDKRLLDLDEKTGDITRAFPALAGISDFKDFNRNPKRIADDLHFFYQERGKVYASTSDKISEDPLDAHVSDMVGWMNIMLPV